MAKGWGPRLAPLVLGVLGGFAAPAHALDFLDGRIQIHGYGETQIRGLDKNFNDNMDLAQWWNILNVEIETSIAPDGWGPFSGISAYSRLEVRYDCVWTRACGMFPSANLYGDRAKNLPLRLGDVRRGGYSGQAFVGDTRRRLAIPVDQLSSNFAYLGNPRRTVGGIWDVDPVDTLFGIGGPDGQLSTRNDNPADYVFANYLGYRFAGRKFKGGEDGNGSQFLGPWLPKNKVIPIAGLGDRANPFEPLDVNPILTPPNNTGVYALPYRPAPGVAANSGVSDARAHGIWVPAASTAAVIESGKLDHFSQNYSQSELAWNHGASQQDEGEFKEGYVDLELADGRAFIRLGKQNIVWGKTELFRTTDQFNPQDLALSSLPSLEESRIALWAARFIYSFYDVGPLSDVRFEVAANIDDFEPADLGRCGEPYTPNPVCDKSMGLFAHGLQAQALLGEQRPPAPWRDLSGLESGARLEFRWDRFSFALTDFWGYDDFPYLKRVATYSRNVDPYSGRPRRDETTQPCTTGAEPACLGPGTDALRHQSVNQTQFALVCASSIGFSQLDLTACGQSVFNSTQIVPPIGPITGILGNVLSGSLVGGQIYRILAFGTFAYPTAFNPLVRLNVDPNDGGGGPLSSRLTDQQEALLGCGAFYGTNCDAQGIDLMNAEASVVMQSFPGFDGVYRNSKFPTLTDGTPQPGTTGFVSSPVGTRAVNGRLVILPGARGPGDPGYDPNVDGTVTAANVIPAQFGASGGQRFRSEMAMFSWNLMQLLVGLSTPAGPVPQQNEFDRDHPFRTDGCSFAKPQYCSSYSAFFTISDVGRNTLRAGGTSRFGRRDFVWHSGGDAVLKYPKRNVLGVSADFAEDTFKSNWSVESTWVGATPYQDNDQYDGLSSSDTYNLTVSVDRPTFINFLNANRTFFFNSQWFFQWTRNFSHSYTSNGPFNVLFTFTVETGYFQDRLTPSMTSVYDFESDSGAFLPSVRYQFSDRFSTEFGFAFFWGRFQSKTMAVNPLVNPGEQVGKYGYHSYVENGLAAVRDRDEIYLRVRYTF